MADNYLEKKYEEYLHGKYVVRRSEPSIDTLLDRVTDSSEAEEPEYAVKQAQLNAMERSVRKLLPEIEFSSHEGSDGRPGVIFIHAGSAFQLGEACLAARLKAAQLHLKTATESTEESAATIKVFR